MDLLKRELERKKKSVQKASSASGTGKRYFRASDRRRQEEEEEAPEKEVQRLPKRKLSDENSDDEKPSSSSNKKSQRSEVVKEKTDNNNNKDEPVDKSTTSSKSETNESISNEEKEKESTAFKLSPEEVSQRLRAFGYPIKLFGESAWDRLKRLRKALDEQKNVQAGLTEMDEFRLGRGHGIRNPFLEKDTEGTTELEDHAEASEVATPAASKEKEEDYDLTNEDDPHKRIYKYFKGLVKKWEEDMNHRPDAVKRSVAGRNELKTMKQCKDYIRPMFKLCKNRRMDESILTKLNRIVSFCLEEEFVRAHDTYIDISIGRAAWPIGVTMVGIHARTGRAKIESSNVAHVMNSELQRKYLTSVKRLMSYAQKKSSAAPSKKVL